MRGDRHAVQWPAASSSTRRKHARQKAGVVTDAAVPSLGGLGRDPALRELAFKPGDETIEFLVVVGIHHRAGRTNMRGRDDTTATQDLLADRQADPWLLLVPHDRKIDVERSSAPSTSPAKNLRHTSTSISG